MSQGFDIKLFFFSYDGKNKTNLNILELTGYCIHEPLSFLADELNLVKRSVGKLQQKNC